MNSVGNIVPLSSTPPSKSPCPQVNTNSPCSQISERIVIGEIGWVTLNPSTPKIGESLFVTGYLPFLKGKTILITLALYPHRDGQGVGLKPETNSTFGSVFLKYLNSTVDDEANINTKIPLTTELEPVTSGELALYPGIKYVLEIQGKQIEFFTCPTDERAMPNPRDCPPPIHASPPTL